MGGSGAQSPARAWGILAPARAPAHPAQGQGEGSLLGEGAFSPGQSGTPGAAGPPGHHPSWETLVGDVRRRQPASRTQPGDRSAMLLGTNRLRLPDPYTLEPPWGPAGRPLPHTSLGQHAYSGGWLERGQTITHQQPSQALPPPRSTQSTQTHQEWCPSLGVPPTQPPSPAPCAPAPPGTPCPSSSGFRDIPVLVGNLWACGCGADGFAGCSAPRQPGPRVSPLRE